MVFLSIVFPSIKLGISFNKVFGGNGATSYRNSLLMFQRYIIRVCSADSSQAFSFSSLSKQNHQKIVTTILYFTHFIITFPVRQEHQPFAADRQTNLIWKVSKIPLDKNVVANIFDKNVVAKTIWDKIIGHYVFWQLFGEICESNSFHLYLITSFSQIGANICFVFIFASLLSLLIEYWCKIFR